MRRLRARALRPLRVAFRRVSRLLAGKESGISPAQAVAIVIGLALLADGLTASISVAVISLPPPADVAPLDVVAALVVLGVGAILLYGTSLRLSRRLDQRHHKTPQIVVKIAAPMNAYSGRTNRKLRVELDEEDVHAQPPDQVRPVRAWLVPSDDSGGDAAGDAETLTWTSTKEQTPPQDMVELTNLATIDWTIEAMRTYYWPNFDREPLPRLYVLLPESPPHESIGPAHEAYLHYLQLRWHGPVHLRRTLPGPQFAATRESIIGELDHLREQQAADPTLAADERHILVDVTGGKNEQRLAAAFAAARMNCTVGYCPQGPNFDGQPPTWVVAAFDD